MHLPSKSVPMNINLLPRLTAYLDVSLKDIVRSHRYGTSDRPSVFPLTHERFTSWENPIGKGVQQ